MRDQAQRRRACGIGDVGPEAVGQHIGIATIVLGACDREAITEAVELLGVDRIDVETTLE